MFGMANDIWSYVCSCIQQPQSLKILTCGNYLLFFILFFGNCRWLLATLQILFTSHLNLSMLCEFIPLNQTLFLWIQYWNTQIALWGSLVIIHAQAFIMFLIIAYILLISVFLGYRVCCADLVLSYLLHCKSRQKPHS